ncbi:MAG TPA: GNAT family N-acetyltransferase [Candidatus Eremiobacteraceae bacterium]|jgi:phosphinothricin acetyltransferase
MPFFIRPAVPADLDAVRRIYNDGIVDRHTLEAREKSACEIAAWFGNHDDRYSVLIAADEVATVGWASLNRYSPREAHRGIADLSIYVDRSARRLGVGVALLAAIEDRARRAGFDKIVLMTFPFNHASRALFGRNGFREIGIYQNQGRLDGRLVATLAMEKLLELPGIHAGVR